MEVSRQDKYSPITGELFIVDKLKNILGTVIQGKMNCHEPGYRAVIEPVTLRSSVLRSPNWAIAAVDGHFKKDII